MLRSRRSFLGLMGGAAVAAAAAGAVLDPERALWVPGQKLISIPRASPNVLIAPEDLARITLEVFRSNLAIARMHVGERAAIAFRQNALLSMEMALRGPRGETLNVRRPRAFIGSSRA